MRRAKYAVLYLPQVADQEGVLCLYLLKDRMPAQVQFPFPTAGNDVDLLLIIRGWAWFNFRQFVIHRPHPFERRGYPSGLEFGRTQYEDGGVGRTILMMTGVNYSTRVPLAVFSPIPEQPPSWVDSSWGRVLRVYV